MGCVRIVQSRQAEELFHKPANFVVVEKKCPHICLPNPQLGGCWNLWILIPAHQQLHCMKLFLYAELFHILSWRSASDLSHFCLLFCFFYCKEKNNHFYKLKFNKITLLCSKMSSFCKSKKKTQELKLIVKGRTGTRIE